MIVQAQQHRAAIVALLTAEKLPVADLPDQLDHFIVALHSDRVVGVVGVEVYGSYGLLRSLAVDQAFRGQGIAAKLIQRIEDLAALQQLTALFLLTETAPGYFQRKNYQTINRTTVPAEVQASSEFSHVCPQSAIVMKKELK